MANRNLLSNVRVEAQLKAASYTTTQTPSNGLDVSGYDSVAIAAFVGAMANASNSPQPSWTLKLEESDTINSGFTAVSSDDVYLGDGNFRNDGSITNGVFATIDAASEDDNYFHIEYLGNKKYVRVVATAANTPGATILWTTFLLGHPAIAPVAQA